MEEFNQIKRKLDEMSVPELYEYVKKKYPENDELSLAKKLIIMSLTLKTVLMNWKMLAVREFFAPVSGRQVSLKVKLTLKLKLKLKTYIFSNISLETPHLGHFQDLGSSSNPVSGAMDCEESPRSGL